MSIIYLIIGVLLLAKGADWFVDGSVSLAKKMKIPSLVIGLTLVAFGTSAPEAAVSIKAALSGSNGIALGNVVGSNLFNLLFILGLTALIKPISIHITTLKKELPFMLFTTAIALMLAYEVGSAAILTKSDGVVLLILFLMYMYSMLDMAKNDSETLDVPSKVLNSTKAVFITVLGITAIVFGADLTVKGAILIAKFLGMSDLIIGLTIISVGTSLPELITSVVAAKKGESDIAIGNIVGSNIFNILFVLGASSSLHPIAVTSDAILDLIILLFTSIIAFVLMSTKNDVNRIEGFILIVLYLCYMLFRIITS